MNILRKKWKNKIEIIFYDDDDEKYSIDDLPI